MALFLYGLEDRVRYQKYEQEITRDTAVLRPLSKQVFLKSLTLSSVTIQNSLRGLSGSVDCSTPTHCQRKFLLVSKQELVFQPCMCVLCVQVCVCVMCAGVCACITYNCKGVHMCG